MPSRQSQSTDIGDSRFYPVSMLHRIRARDLDFDSSCLRPIRDTYPSIPCESKWIDGVRNHGSTETEIIFGDHVTNAIARIIERVADDS
ncbi:MAG: hypothetical protein WA350_18000, partial [Candidatus Sulfotelmatobacter sp.]